MKIIFITIILALLSVTAIAATNNGKMIYEKSCKTCHNPSTAPLMKAPAAHDVNAWKERMAAAKKETKNGKAMSILVAAVENGKGAMPAKGMCNDCSDQDYKDAINYMRQAGKK